MGLSSQYQAKQKSLTQTNKNLCLKFNRTKSLNKAFPSVFLVEVFPFILLSLATNYADYAVSRDRINTFLRLPEENYNLAGKKINPAIPITAITFRNVYFRYQGQSEWVLKNYSRTLTPDKVNRLIGKNGAGKSTVLYLLLGMLVPHKGQIIITDLQEQNYNLHQEGGSTGQKQLANLNQILERRKDAQIFCFDEADNA
ncbi:14189_t:CDS:2, partial [Funneliformis geosporum]